MSDQILSSIYSFSHKFKDPASKLTFDLKNKNITAYSIQDFSQCQHKTWLDFLETPKDFSKNYDPWLEIIRKIGIEHERNYLDELKKSENIYEIDKNLSFEAVSYTHLTLPTKA